MHSYYAVNANACHSSENFGVRSSSNMQICDNVKEGISHFLETRTHIFQLQSNIDLGDGDLPNKLKQILSKSSNYLPVENELKGINDSRSLNTHFIHLMPCSLCLFSNNKYKMAQEPLKSFNSLMQLLSEYGLQLSKPPVDLKVEDSFFFSLISSLAFMLDQVFRFETRV